jgi:hypothetical protein
MKRYFFVVMALMVLVSCKKDRVSGSGEIITETRNVANFYNVSVSSSTNVSITRGDNFEVKVKAYENIVPYLETKIQDGTLLIAFKDNSNIRNDNSEVFITMPSLNSVATSGSGNITSTGAFLGSGNFKASTSGSGNISIDGGSADNLQVNIYGSGGVKSFGFVAQQTVVNSEGSGNAEITVMQNLNATISGSGNVYYKGNPATINSKITGSGQLIKQ